ncbi:MAG: purine/pyrimidine permease [Treponemataceae bacterium]|nr:MAG: purine/pyrimidine permease [Treponemataceae bacterium]
MIRYGLDSVLDNKKTAAYGLQHLVMFIANSVVISVIAANGIGLGKAETSGMLLRTFFLCGVLSVVQTRLGHRYPIIDGPSGLWLSVLINLTTAAASAAGDIAALRSQIEFGMAVAGVIVAALGISGAMKHIARLFTPLVNGVFLVLMPVQLSKSIVQGMFGTVYGGSRIDPKEFAAFWLTVAVMIAVNIFGSAFLKSIAILIAIAAGWVFAACAGIADFGIMSGGSFFMPPRPFAWGVPSFNPGIIITCVFATFLLFSNFISSCYGMADVIGESFSEKQLNRGTMCFGLSTAVTGLFATVGFVPFGSSMGVIRMTGVAARKPFYLGSIAMVALGLIAPVGLFFASIPPSVGYGALFVLFAIIMKQGIDNFKKAALTERTGLAAGLAMLTATGIMMQPPAVFDSLPDAAAPFVSNGLLVGVILAVVLEQALKERNRF